MPEMIDTGALDVKPTIKAPKITSSSPSTNSTDSASNAKLHKVARQFEAVFLTEMLRLARPADKAAPGFSTGESGGTWQVFMDQALGEAATANGGSGLAKQIEDSLRRTHSTLKGSGS